MLHQADPSKCAFDLVIIGSGCAGLVAALTAALAGASVIVLEKTRYLGGTSAMSGGGTWVPANHHAIEAGISDSIQEALEYIGAASPAGWERTEADLWKNYAAHAPDVLRLLEANTPLRFELTPEPDPFAELQGGKSVGRMLSPLPLSKRLLGKWSRYIRPSTLPHIFTYYEVVTQPLFRNPFRTVLKLLPQIAGRWMRRERGQGTALIVGLAKGCIDAGCELALNARAVRLMTDEDGQVVGVEATVRGKTAMVRARKGVVIASGGFEWDDDLVAEHFPGGVHRVGSPRSNTGDGQRMARAVGAQLDRMDQANMWPCLPTRYEGKPHGLPFPFQAAPHAIAVNNCGIRFANELDCNFSERLDARDHHTGAPINLPAWVIVDRRFMANAPVFKWYAANEPEWQRSAGTIEQLAVSIGVPASALVQTIERFNADCQAGFDKEFFRGESIWDRWRSRRAEGQSTNSALGSIEQPPFFAFSLGRSLLGTKGGARTNEKGEVVRDDGSVIRDSIAQATPWPTRSAHAPSVRGRRSDPA